MTDPDIPRLKAVLRRQMRAQLEALQPVDRRQFSTRACQLLRSQPIWRDAQRILFYAPMPIELNIWPLFLEALALGKTLALPRFVLAQQHYEAAQITDLASDLHPGKLGIQEPAAHCPVISLNQLDLVLVPGVAFDGHGRRLGRGKGYYDMLLKPVQGTKCGVAFDFQVKDSLPEEPHDVRLDCILTPSRWLIAGRAAV